MLCRIEWWNDRWLEKDMEGNGCGLIGVIPRHLPEGKLRKTSVRVAGVSAEIRSKHLPKMSTEASSTPTRTQRGFVFSQSLQMMIERIPSITPRPLPSTSLPIHSSLIILQLDAK
jgi:hypothetical protein